MSRGRKKEETFEYSPVENITSTGSHLFNEFNLVCVFATTSSSSDEPVASGVTHMPALVSHNARVFIDEETRACERGDCMCRIRQ